MWLWILMGLGAAFVAGVAAASESERRRQLAPPAKPPTRLLTSVASDVRISIVALSDAHTLCELDISPGVEVFTPPLPKGKRLKLIFTGACAIKQSSSPWIGLDTCYSA